MNTNSFHILLVDDMLIRGDFETSWRRAPVENELGKQSLELCLRSQDRHPDDKWPATAMVDGFEAGVQHVDQCSSNDWVVYIWANGSLLPLSQVADDDLAKLAEEMRREMSRRRENKRELARQAKERRKYERTSEIPF